MTHPLCFERLENRILPAVTAVFNASQALLTLTGDDAGDSVRLVGGTSHGQVEVFINDVTQGAFTGVQTIRANLGGGDDALDVQSVRIAQDFVVNAGEGDDAVVFRDTQPYRVFIGGKLSINLGGNPGDDVSIRDENGSGIVVHEDLIIVGAADVELDGNGGSSSSVPQPADVILQGKLSVSLSGHGDVNGDGDEIELNDVAVVGNTLLKGSEAMDRVEIASSIFTKGKVKIVLGDGDDVVDLDEGTGSQNLFYRNVVINFGDGTDTLFDHPQNFYSGSFKTRKGPEITPI
jgi:hypothetical protein